MRPFKIFIFFLVVLFIISLVSYLVPESVPLPFSLSIKTPSIHFSDSFLPPSKDSSQIFLTKKEPVDSLTKITSKPDTFQQGLVKAIPDSVSRELEFKTSLKTRKALYSFFARLDSARYLPGGLRILYYGDSQIEGDRITSTLRDSLQGQFGGSGPGLISPRMVVSYTKSVRILYSGNWRRYTLLDFNNSILSSNQLGVMLSLCRFNLPSKFRNNGNVTHEGTIQIRASKMGHPNAEQFLQARLFLANVKGPTWIEWHPIPGLVRVDTVRPDKTLQEIVWRTPTPITNLQVKFRAISSPDVFCLALDGKNGVAVDNIPLRGSSGTDFSKTDTSLLREMYKRLNVQMIILHFGLNRVKSSLKSYSSYQKSLTGELLLLEKLRPRIPIIVVGISDMDQKTRKGYVSYPSVEKIRRAQKRAAQNTGCLFWDLYDAMGGEDSMGKWVTANPQLGKEDYAHFTYKGAEKVGAMFYKNLKKEYGKFKMTKIKRN